MISYLSLKLQDFLFFMTTYKYLFPVHVSFLYSSYSCPFPKHYSFCNVRFEPDMLAFSGCYYGGGEKERRELGAIRKRWKGLHVCMLLCYHMIGALENQDRIS